MEEERAFYCIYLMAVIYLLLFSNKSIYMVFDQIRLISEGTHTLQHLCTMGGCWNPPLWLITIVEPDYQEPAALVY